MKPDQAPQIDESSGFWARMHARWMPGYNRPATIYWLALVVAGSSCTLFAGFATARSGADALWVTAVGVGAALFSSALPMKVPRANGDYTLTGVITFLVLLSAGPWPAVLVAVADGAMGAWRARAQPTTQLAAPASFAISMCVVGWLWVASRQWLVEQGVPAESALILLTVAAGALDFAMSTLGMLALRAFKRRESVVFSESQVFMVVPVVLTALMAALLYLATQHAGAQVLVASGLVAAGLVVGAHGQAHRQSLRLDQDEARTHELRRLADQDPLTGLPNRRAFQDVLLQAVEASRIDPGLRFGLMYLDFDRFKQINDSLGHQAGDQLLMAASRRIQQQLRSTDVVARLGGDEFAVLIDPLVSDGHAVALATRLLESLGQPFELSGQPVSSQASIGTTLAGGSDPRGYAELLHDADTAMFDAKSAGRGCFRVFAAA